MKRRRRRCSGRCGELVERLAPYVQPAEPEPARPVSVVPIGWWLQGWAAATGDQPEVIARGFDLDADVVELLLAGEIRVARRFDAVSLRRALGVDLSLLRPEPCSWGRCSTCVVEHRRAGRCSEHPNAARAE